MTRRAREGKARVLSLEVELLAAEVQLLEELIAAGIMPPGARREPTAPELRAGVRFANLDRIVNDAARLLLRKTEPVRAHVLDGLAEQLAPLMGEADPYAALEALDRLTDPTRGDTLPGLRKVIDDTTNTIAADLVATAHAGAAEALDEARRQGVPDRLIGDVTLGPEVEQAAATHARRVATYPAIRLLDAAAQGGARAATAHDATGATVLDGALTAAEDASVAGVEDTARQAANVTHGLGRAAAQQALPAPREVYASELLDKNTCGPCATVDGRTYRSLADGLVDYPGAGGYIGCEGGARCRGTLVLVHGTEAPPTLDNPGHGPAAPGGPADRTPQGPSGVTRPGHIAADGSLIPTAPDPGTPPPTDLGARDLGVDDQGRTIVPAGIEPPVTTVAPDTVERDPELATYSDDELDALMGDPNADPERMYAAAIEYDRRQAGEITQVWEEEALDAATLARYEAEREAWEAAGGYAAEVTALGDNAATAGGRRIDHVRRLWSEEVEQQRIRAEEETTGYLIRKDRLEEFRRKYGTDAGVLFEGPARTAYYYASPELVDYWASLDTGRQTFAEFAAQRGIRDRKTLDRARKAAEARDEAILRADADRPNASARTQRRNAAKGKRKRLPMTEGDRLVLAQKRRDRIRAAERKRARDLGLEEVPNATP